MFTVSLVMQINIFRILFPFIYSAVQGIGNLTVALASHALSLLVILLEDLHIEGLSLVSEASALFP